MHIKVNLDGATINQCLLLHYNHHPLGRKNQKKLLWIPIILLAISAYLIYTEMQKDHFSSNFYLALLYIVFALAYYFYMKKRMLTAGNTMQKALGNNANFEMDVTEDKITTVTSTTTVITDWTVFTGALVNDYLVLLYQANDTFSM